MPQELKEATIRPLRDPQVAIDLRSLAIEVLERELAARAGGNAVLNRLEAEAWVDMLARGEIRGAEALSPAFMAEATSPHSMEGSTDEVHSHHRL